jgi:nitrite reductase (NO-forming)
MKRIASLVAVLAVAAVSVFTVVAYAGSSHATTTTITVKASEFKFVLSKKSARHGKVTFKVTNKGHVSHDFKINGKKTPLVKPGKSASLTVTLKKGSFKYVCTVPGHAAAGMKGTFKAT